MRFRLLAGVQVADRRTWSPLERALLTVLIIGRNRPLSVEMLIDALWPDDPPPDAKGSLQSKISRLRPLLGPEALRFSSGAYTLTVEPDECDLNMFERFADAAFSPTNKLRRRIECADSAIALWGGNRTVQTGSIGAVLSECVRIEARRDALAVERLGLLWEVGDYATVIADGAALAEECPYSDRVCELRMRSLARAGRLVEALRLFATYRKQLDDEIGVVPSRALSTVEEELLRSFPEKSDAVSERTRISREGPRVDVATSGEGGVGSVAWTGPIAHRPDFVGREAILASLRQRLLSNVGSAVGWGEPGVGKSRVLAEMVRLARTNSISTTLLRCPPPPSTMFAAIDRLVGFQDVDTGQRSMAGRGEMVAQRTTALIRHIEGVGSKVTDAAVKHLLVVDDLQWIDEGSVMCLHAISESLELGYLSGVSILLASRPSVEMNQQVRSEFDRLLRPLGALSFTLEGLNEPEMAGVLNSVFGRSTSARLSTSIHTRSAGNPLLAIAEVARLHGASDLRVVNETIDMGPTRAGSVVPGDLLRCLDEVFNRLSPGTQQFLKRIAFEPTGVVPDAPLLAESPLQSELAALCDAGLLSIRQGRYMFTHHAYRQVTLQRTDPDTRRRTHQHVAAALLEDVFERGERTADTLISLSHHMVEGGMANLGGPHADQELNGAVAGDHHRMLALYWAGLTHLRLTDWEQAVVVLGYADEVATSLRRVGTATNHAWREVRLAIALARFHTHDARGALDAVRDVLSDDDDVELCAHALTVGLRAQLTMDQHASKLDPVFVHALIARCEQDSPAFGARLVGLLSEQNAALGRLDEARRYAEASLRQAHKSGQPLVLAEASFANGLTALGQIDIVDADQHFRNCQRFAVEAGSAWTEGWALGRRAYLSYLTDPLSQTSRLLEVARRHQMQLLAWAELSVVAMIEAYVADAANESDRADALSSEAERLMLRSGYPFTAPMLFPWRLHRAVILGDVSRAESAIAGWKEFSGRVPDVAQALVSCLHGRRPAPVVRAVSAQKLHFGHLPLIGLYKIVAALSGDTSLGAETDARCDDLIGRGIQRLPGSLVTLA